SVLYPLPQDNGAIGVQPGDTVNILGTGTFKLVDPQTGTTRTVTGTYTVMTKLLVYAVDVPAKGKIVVVVTNKQAEILAMLEHSSVALTFVIRKPGDTSDPIDLQVLPNGG
ncbi:MAG TPA: hypothetical protein VFU69_05495, partial [Ktedonobacterales bacterium]|nr:hypothetical protein [Ktedonobacterales bacterium]